MLRIGTSILSIIVLLYFQSAVTRTSHIIFCDIGQGSATFVTVGSVQILIDTGPNMRTLACIGKHMPFFDHTIEFVIISHDQKDHAGALPALLKKYKIGHIIGPPEIAKRNGNIPFTTVTNTVRFTINSLQLIIIRASQSSTDLNEAANVVTIRSPLHVIFLTSDINGFELQRLIPTDTTILSIPHHGSKYGLYPDSLGLARPTHAVISVGKKNTYGHPSKEVLDILKAKKIHLWRTDVQGELVIDL
ncbi:MAG: hypothetical protein WAV30_04765 [Microgenomates group bacterium]